jgi:hypothetical protein
MLDVLDFITERGGNPEKIRESQRRRYADEKVVDEIIAQWEDHRKSLSSPPLMMKHYSLTHDQPIMLRFK